MRKEEMVVGKVYNVRFHVDDKHDDEVSVVCIGESVNNNPVYLTVGEGYHRHVKVNVQDNIVEDILSKLDLGLRNALVFEGNPELMIQRVYLDSMDNASEELYTFSNDKIIEFREYAMSFKLNFSIKPLT